MSGTTMHPDIADHVTPDGRCCVLECGRLGSHYLGARIWAVSDPDHKTGAVVMETPLLVCDQHREKMPHSAAEFFLPDTRARLTLGMRAVGKDTPDYDTAEWVFKPMALPAKGASN